MTNPAMKEVFDLGHQNDNVVQENASHLSFTTHNSPQYSGAVHPSHQSVQSFNILTDLDTRFPALDIPRKIAIASKHTTYTMQASTIANEANDLEKYCSSMAPAVSSNEHSHTHLSDVPKRLQNVNLLHQMRAVCIEKVQAFETGSLEEIKRLLVLDNEAEVLVQTWFENDQLMQRQLSEGWPHLTAWEQTRRLKLLWFLLLKQWKAEKDLAGLEDTMAGFGIRDMEQEATERMENLMKGLAL